VSEPASAPPLRTWRPMAAWTAGILLALGLALMVGLVVIPYCQARRVLNELHENWRMSSLPAFRSIPDDWLARNAGAGIEKLGGPEHAAGRLGLYLRMPHWLTREECRAWAAACLAYCGRWGEPALAEALRAPPGPRKCGALAGGPPSTGDPLMDAFCAGPGVRELALRALLAAPTDYSPRVVTAVAEVLKDPNQDIRRLACSVRALAGPGAEPAVPGLAALIDDPVSAVRLDALDALGRIGTPAVPVLAGALDHSNHVIRWRAAHALGSMLPETAAAIPALQAALRSPDESVRSEAAEALRKVRSPGQPALSAAAAKKALLLFLKEHPAVFVSPGTVESTSELLKEEPSPVTEQLIWIGRFQVQLDTQAYVLVHQHENPDSQWREFWEWRGGFEFSAPGLWQATEPRFVKAMKP
jgi:hypothetical protein